MEGAVVALEFPRAAPGFKAAGAVINEIAVVMAMMVLVGVRR
jgi:hypothetical protein